MLSQDSILQMIFKKPWTYPAFQSDCQSDTVVPGQGHRTSQCLWSYSARILSPDPHLCPSQLKDLLNSHSAYFLGTNQTLSLLQYRFWWPGMANDIRRYVRGCQECAMAKTLCHLPFGKLLPLPIPLCSWSHLGVNFCHRLTSIRW